MFWISKNYEDKRKASIHFFITKYSDSFSYVENGLSCETIPIKSFIPKLIVFLLEDILGPKSFHTTLETLNKYFEYLNEVYLGNADWCEKQIYSFLKPFRTNFLVFHLVPVTLLWTHVFTNSSKKRWNYSQ